MTDLLETGVEALREHVEIVTERFGGRLKQLVRHHGGGCEIVRKRDAVEPARSIVERPGAADDGVDAARAFGEPDLERELKRPSGAIDQFRDQELPAMAIK